MLTKNIPPFKQWQLSATRGIDGLRLVEDASITQLGDEEVLVEMHAASLNFLDLFVANVWSVRILSMHGRSHLTVLCKVAILVR